MSLKKLNEIHRKHHYKGPSLKQWVDVIGGMMNTTECPNDLCNCHTEHSSECYECGALTVINERMNEKSASSQNERMREWFRKRTGLDALLGDQMKAIDELINVPLEEYEK